MNKIIELSVEQKQLFQDAFTGANQTAMTAQVAIDLAGAKRKALEDLIIMYCISNKLDKAKVKIDSQTWTITYEEEEMKL